MAKAAKPTADDRDLFSMGARTVRQAAAESGLSRNELFDLMDAGVLPWFPHTERRTRLIPWKAVVEYLASLYAESRGAGGADVSRTEGE